jgi:hypothetical protein
VHISIPQTRNTEENVHPWRSFVFPSKYNPVFSFDRGGGKPPPCSSAFHNPQCPVVYRIFAVLGKNAMI